MSFGTGRRTAGCGHRVGSHQRCGVAWQPVGSRTAADLSMQSDGSPTAPDKIVQGVGDSLRNRFKNGLGRGTVPFCSEDWAELGQSPAVFETVSEECGPASPLLQRLARWLRGRLDWKAT